MRTSRKAVIMLAAVLVVGGLIVAFGWRGPGGASDRPGSGTPDRVAVAALHRLLALGDREQWEAFGGRCVDAQDRAFLTGTQLRARKSSADDYLREMKETHAVLRRLAAALHPREWTEHTGSSEVEGRVVLTIVELTIAPISELRDYPGSEGLATLWFVFTADTVYWLPPGWASERKIRGYLGPVLRKQPV